MLSSILVMSPLTAFAAEDESSTETIEEAESESEEVEEIVESVEVETVEETENEQEKIVEAIEETITEKTTTEALENAKTTDDTLVDEPSEEVIIKDIDTPLTGPIKSEIEVTYNEDGTATVVNEAGETFTGIYSYDDKGNLVLEVAENGPTNVYTLNIAYSSDSDTGFDIYTVTENTDINELSDISKNILNAADIDTFASGYNISAEITDSGINIISVTKTEGEEAEMERTIEKVFTLEAEETDKADEVVIADEVTPLAGSLKKDKAVDDVRVTNKEPTKTTEEITIETKSVETEPAEPTHEELAEDIQTVEETTEEDIVEEPAEDTTETNSSESTHDESTEDVKKEDVVVKVEDIEQAPEITEIETSDELD